MVYCDLGFFGILGIALFVWIIRSACHEEINAYLKQKKKLKEEKKKEREKNIERCIHYVE